MHPAIIPVGLLATVVVGAGTALRLKALRDKEKGSLVVNVVPRANVPIAKEVQTNRVIPPGLPVINAEQFKAQTPIQQEDIRKQALAGILTLSATNGTLFSEKPPEPAENFIGSFKNGDDLFGTFFVADAALARRFGTPLPISEGNMIFEPLEIGGASIPGKILSISRDPRAVGLKMHVALNAITGAGDPNMT